MDLYKSTNQMNTVFFFYLSYSNLNNFLASVAQLSRKATVQVLIQ